MSTNPTLPARVRTATEKPSHLRAARQITAEFYGAGKSNVRLALDYQTFRRVYRSAGESTVIDLAIEGGTTEPVLVHDVQYHPISDEFLHVDFLAVNMQKKVTAHVPVHFVGVAPAVKTHGGIFSHTKTEVAVRCLPAHLPHAIEVDVSNLTELHASVHVSDLPVDRSKVEVLDSADVVVATVLPPKTAAQIEAELAEPVGDAMSEEARKAAEAEKAAAQASKQSDTEKKGNK